MRQGSKLCVNTRIIIHFFSTDNVMFYVFLVGCNIPGNLYAIGIITFRSTHFGYFARNIIGEHK